MSTRSESIEAPVVFLSDIHLDDMVPERINRFERFLLEDLGAMGVHHVFLLGDIFNIWYRDGRIEALFGQRIFRIMETFVQKGGQLEYVVGNRDFALCFDPQLKLPFPIHRKSIQRTIGGLRFHLCHGDDLSTADYGYFVLHGLIRQKMPMAMFHSLSAERKEHYVKMLIDLTHKVKKKKPYWKTEPNWEYVTSLVDQGVDVCIQGHRHYRTYRILEGEKRIGRHFVLPRWRKLASGLLYCPEKQKFSFFDQ